MLNRNAEALFWIGRYMERAENHARLIDVHYHLQAEDELVNTEQHADQTVDNTSKWMRIVDALGSRESFEQQYGVYTEQDVLHYATLDRDNENSLVCCVNHARGNLRTLREKVPAELWDVVNAFYLWLRDKEPEDMIKESPHLFYGRIKEWTALFHGYGQSVMPRENEWHFIECGRYLERAENTLRIIKAANNVTNAESWSSTESYAYLLAVLKSLSGFQPFRRYYADGVSVEAIMEFVVINPVFPRSVHFAFHALEEHMRQIELQDPQLRTSHDRMLRQVGKVKADMACLEREDIMIDRSGQIVSHLVNACQQLGTAFAKTFFRMGEASA
ncbi:alpha-E domain-containing protein [Paenibacillus protaetiae]|uniref:Alpha-E domain-containing protein n=1 Tax=Paenibacillus protaetiae TaxID=2509456 RepID=A0A4P6F3R9_9BACL|nr:alpha-E domain-containing protein [Paenibacillus protaetiae]QAY65028.1 alpha-E domain-containing protein [Paenibacillus protaetiae]